MLNIFFLSVNLSKYLPQPLNVILFGPSPRAHRAHHRRENLFIHRDFFRIPSFLIYYVLQYYTLIIHVYLIGQGNIWEKFVLLCFHVRAFTIVVFVSFVFILVLFFYFSRVKLLILICTCFTCVVIFLLPLSLLNFTAYKRKG